MDNNQEPTGSSSNKVDNIKSRCDRLRGTVKSMAKYTLDLKQDPHFKADNPSNGEMLANIMLAYRHLEDARMRLGKVIQAYDGRVSCYDKAFESQDKFIESDSLEEFKNKMKE